MFLPASRWAVGGGGVIPAIAIGRAGSSGFKSKNVHPILGRPLCAYPVLAAHHSRGVDKVYVSTDWDAIARVAREHGAEVIDRPANLATNAALSQDAFKYGYDSVVALNRGTRIEMAVLLFCNGATITPGIIDRGIEAMRKDPTLDSAVTISRYNMWSPLRAHRIENGLLIPFFDAKQFEGANCDRNSQGDVFFPDCSAFVVRPRCFDYAYGAPPFPWIGRKVFPLEQWGGCDIDYEWQVPLVEYWLREHGFSETASPYSNRA